MLPSRVQLHSGGGQGGGSPGVMGVGSLWAVKAGDERAGDGIPN